MATEQSELWEQYRHKRLLDHTVGGRLASEILNASSSDFWCPDRQLSHWRKYRRFAASTKQHEFHERLIPSNLADFEAHMDAALDFRWKSGYLQKWEAEHLEDHDETWRLYAEYLEQLGPPPPRPGPGA